MFTFILKMGLVLVRRGKGKTVSMNILLHHYASE